MGISYNPLLGVGKVFDETSEAVEWFVEQFPASSRKEIDEYGLEEYLYGEPTLQGISARTLNYYNGYGFIIYIPLYAQDIDKFSELLVEAKEKWKKVFNTEPEVVHEVGVS